MYAVICFSISYCLLHYSSAQLLDKLLSQNNNNKKDRQLIIEFIIGGM